MSQLKENLRAYGHLLGSFMTAARVIIFEKFSAVFFFFYLLFVLSLGFLLCVIHWSAALIVLLFGFLLFTGALQGFQFLKRALIRKGDRIEYADPKAAETDQIFKKAKVLLKMRFEEVQKSKLIPQELMEGNSHFFLVETDKKPTIIAYDWIIGISPEMLD